MTAPKPTGDVTRLLDALNDGDAVDRDVRAELYTRIYDELHELAEMHRGRWLGNDTLNTTALVHEAYIKLIGSNGRFENRSHFLAVASKAMRQVLSSYARRQSAQKRGGAAPDVTLNEEILIPPEKAEAFVALETALSRLEDIDLRAAEVVECRFFGGLTVTETAEALDISERTVAREWVAARTWLYGELTRELGSAVHSGSGWLSLHESTC